jgi:hypothetical protein
MHHAFRRRLASARCHLPLALNLRPDKIVERRTAESG